MAGMTRQQLDEVLSRFATSHPANTRFTEREFVLLPPPTKSIRWAFILLGVIFVPLFVAGLAGVIAAIINPGLEDRLQLGLSAAFCVLFPLVLAAFVRLARSGFLAFDLHTGDVSTNGRGHPKVVANLATARAFRPLLLRVQRWSSVPYLQLEVPVPGKPTFKWISVWNFPSKAELDAFMPVIDALFRYFHPEPGVGGGDADEAGVTGPPASNWEANR